MKRLLYFATLILVLTSSKPVKVACIGDSITYGARCEDREENAFPFLLGKMLGPDYDVRNFGYGWRVMMDTGDFPYMKEQMYSDVKAFLPDIVTIMLGTNDSKPMNWTDRTAFHEDMRKMVDDLQKLPSHPRIYLMTPTPVRNDGPIEPGTIVDTTIVNQIIPEIKAVAVRRWLDFIDLRTPLLGHGEMFPDGIHPNAAGHKVIAQTIYDAFEKRGDTGKPGKRIIFIGDSITDGGWAKADSRPCAERNHYDMNHIMGHSYAGNCAQYWQVKYPERNYTFYNRGIGGNNMPRLVERWDDDVLALRPSVVSVLIGINDVGRHTTEDFDFARWEASYRSIIEKTLAADPDTKMVLCTPFCSNTGTQVIKDEYKDRVKVVEKEAQIVRRLADEYGLVLVDFEKLFEDIYAHDKSVDSRYWMWDGIHPTMPAHLRMSEAWNKAAKKVMK